MPDFENVSARLASLDEIVKYLANHITPVPSRDTVRDWLDKAQIPRYKASPTARRGGGTVYYSLSATEKMIRQRTLSGKISTAVIGVNRSGASSKGQTS